MTAEQGLPGVRRDQQVTELADAFVTGEPVTGPAQEIVVLEGLRTTPATLRLEQ